MPVVPILKYPDKTLSRDSEPIRQITGKVAGMLNSMVDTMYAADGIGLAAPQIGHLERAIVVDIDPKNRGKKLLKLINPEITEREGEITWEEGCLSVVNYSAEVKRSRRILLSGWTVDQKQVEIEAEELEAVCLQHELDHLDGVLFIDHISRIKREMYRKRARRLARERALDHE